MLRLEPRCVWITSSFSPILPRRAFRPKNCKREREEMVGKQPSVSLGAMADSSDPSSVIVAARFFLPLLSIKFGTLASRPAT